MKNKRKLLSIMLSISLVFSTVFGNSWLANAAPITENKTSIEQQKLQNEIKKILAQNLKKGNKDFSEKQINPEEEVRIIIESEKESTLEIAKERNLSINEAVKLEDSIKVEQATLISKIKKFGTIKHQYVNVINGVSATVKYKNIEKIKKLPGVKKVTIANVYYPDMTTAVGLTKADTVWNGELKLKGEGTVVSIIDSGIDVTHNDMVITDKTKAKLDQAKVTELGGPGKFYTDKVPYGYNYADMNDIIIDRGKAGMHGMHVAGIVAANGKIKGVAPEAQLLALKVFSNNMERGGAWTDDITAAIEDSVRHKADVINMSLGSTAGFVDPLDPEQIAIKNAVDNGVVVVVSGGNSYYSTYPNYGTPATDPDTGLVGSPGLGLDTMQIASFENSHVTLTTLKSYIDGQEKAVAYQKQSSPDPVEVFGSQKLEAVYVGTGEPSFYEGKDVSGKLVFAVRTGGFFYSKIQKQAEAAGAKGVIIRGSEGHGDYVNMALDNPTIPLITLSIADGNYFEEQAKAGKKLEFVFTNDTMAVPNATANYMSDFSSWGPTPDLSFKPEVTAPGGNIYSTVNDNKYENMSGTSMSAPHASGVTALVVQYLKSQNIKIDGQAPTGRQFVELAKKLIMNTAEPINDPDSELPYVTRKQGAGLVQVDKAIKTKVFVTTEGGKAAVELREVGKEQSFKLLLTNFGDKEQTFIPKDNYGVLTSYVQEGQIYPYTANIPNAAVTFDKTEVVIPAGGTVELNVKLTIPDGTAKNIFAEGFITFESKDGGNVNLGIPYMGFYGEWDAPKIFDDPYWKEDTTIYGMTQLATAQNTESLKGIYGMEGGPDKISISPDGDGYYDNVMPIVSLLRNAKELKVQIVDSNGNILRELLNDSNVRKNYGTAESGVYKILSDATWDGTLFDDATKQFKLAEEGKYYVRLTGRIDFEGAEWNTLDIPVNVDLTAPEIKVTSNEAPTGRNEYNLTWEATDNVGVEQYLVFLNGKNITPEAGIEGTATSFTVPNLINGANTIIIAAVDYAGNIQLDGVAVDNTLLTFNVEKEILTNKSEVAVGYEINPSILSLVDHTDVVVDGNAINNGKNTSITISNLKEGVHTAVFNVYEAGDKLLATDTIKITVDKTYPTVSIMDMEGNSLNDAELTEKLIDVQLVPSEALKALTLKVNGVDAVLTKVDELKYTASLTLKDGINRVTFTAEDLAGNVNGYGYKILVDSLAPELNIVEPANIENPIVLGKDISSYKITVKCGDNVAGYNLYINGTPFASDYSDMLEGVEVKSYDYNYTNIPNGVSVVNVKLVDYFGNTTEKNITFIKDVTAPKITVTSPVNGSTVKGKKVTVEGLVEDETATTLKINGEVVTVNEDGSFAKEITYSEFGEKTIQIEAVDANGNKTSSPLTIKVVEADVQSVKAIASATSVETGKAITLSAIATLKDETAKDVTSTVVWKLSNSTIAKIEGNKLTGLKDGVVKVYAEINGVKSNEITITVKKPVQVAKNVIIVKAGKLNVRAAATTRSARIGSLRRGQFVELLGVTNGWYKIKYNGKVGYVASRYAIKTQYVEYNVTKKVKVTARILNVRKYPYNGTARVGRLRRNTTVTVLGYINGWYKISYRGREAYISARYTR